MPVRALSQLVVFPAVLTAACGASARTAEQSGSGGANVAATTAEGSESSEPSEAEATPSAARPRLNLLGDVNTELGEGRRNKNVRLTLIDHSVLRELNRARFVAPVVNGSSAVFPRSKARVVLSGAVAARCRTAFGCRSLDVERLTQLPGGLPTVGRLGIATRGNTSLSVEEIHYALERGVRYFNWCGKPDGLSRGHGGVGGPPRGGRARGATPSAHGRGGRAGDGLGARSDWQREAGYWNVVLRRV